MKRPGSKQANESDHDQVDGHDKIQEFGHDQYEDPCQERDQGCQTEVKVHDFSKLIEPGTRPICMMSPLPGAGLYAAAQFSGLQGRRMAVSAPDPELGAEVETRFDHVQKRTPTDKAVLLHNGTCVRFCQYTPGPYLKDDDLLVQ